MSVLCAGLSHRTAPVELRERFALAKEAIPAAIGRLREAGVASEAVWLSTCNRVEIYAAVESEAAGGEGLREHLIATSRAPEGATNGEVYVPEGNRRASSIFFSGQRPRFDGAGRDSKSWAS
jgi:glutamyl-tRNA reductase